MSLRALMPIRYWSSCSQVPQDALRKNLLGTFGRLMSTPPRSADCAGPLHVEWTRLIVFRSLLSCGGTRRSDQPAQGHGTPMQLSSRPICSRIVLHTRTMMRSGIVAVRTLLVVVIVLVVRVRVVRTTRDTYTVFAR